ncbi:CDP-alcohol phosphatidyltransferase family protein, partial [Nostocoides japonicum]|uniref:CDP-alcohol phosphatidyltransferase family protein n=1 Tax=Nostocoides japonicum TaxID=99481 RepID=UPI001F2C14FF
MMRSVHLGPPAGLVAQLVLLGALAASVGLGGAGWVAGAAVAVVVTGGLALGMDRYAAVRLGPADRVTLARATLVVGVAALSADVLAGPGRTATPVLVALSTVALVLDAVDGQVARRTRTDSALGARFDMEVDALLILVLSVLVASSAGAWVLAIGVARYAFGAAQAMAPWLRAPTPPRRWRKAVAALQGIVLTVAAAGVLAPGTTRGALVVALALLVVSFGTQARELWARRRAPAPA